jgi:hypothetical protein
VPSSVERAVLTESEMLTPGYCAASTQAMRAIQLTAVWRTGSSIGADLKNTTLAPAAVAVAKKVLSEFQ